MGLDYFSELGQQTVNAEPDGSWIQYNRNIGKQTQGRHLFDCPSRVTADLPSDIMDGRPPIEKKYKPQESLAWNSTPLYTNLCLNTIPVMIHHNGDKSAREHSWPRLWLQKEARQLMVDIRNQSAEGSAIGGAYSGDKLLTWDELCPAAMHEELYREPKAG